MPQEVGNIDLRKQPRVKNPDGTTSTVRSISINDGGQEILIPTVVGNKVVSDEEAIDEYRRTGKHLGKFDSVEDANTAAERLHNEYAAGQYDDPQQKLIAKVLDSPDEDSHFHNSIHKAIERELEVNPQEPQLELNLPQGMKHSNVNPTVAALLGAAGDAASTYHFMKKGGGAEDNALFGGLKGPGQTALGVAGSSVGSILLAKLLGKKIPALRDAYIANQGATSIGLAGENFSYPKRRKVSGFDSVNEKLAAEIGKK